MIVFSIPSFLTFPATTAAAAAADLQPLLSLNGDQLTRLVPLLTKVSPETLKTIFPLLAQQPAGTVDKLVKVLQQVGKTFSKYLLFAELFHALTHFVIYMHL